MSIKQPVLPSVGRSFIANSHPEREEREPAKARKAVKAYEINPSIQARLEAYKREHPEETNVSIGRRLGYPDGTVVSKYLLTGKAKSREEGGVNAYDRDPSDIERKLLDFFRAETRMQMLDCAEILATSVVKQCANFYDEVRQGRFVGVLHAPAGLGKSTAALAYVEANPTTMLLSANAAQCDARGVRQLMWAQVETRGMAGNVPRWQHLIGAFKDSGRLIIVDNAQRLERSGRDLLFDFMDETGCPLVLQGNPEIKDRVRRNDQQHSRTLMEYSPTLKNVETVVREYLALRTDRGAEIQDLAVDVVKRKSGGHLRALRNLLMLAELLQGDPKSGGDFRKAFEKAMALSIAHKGGAA